MTDKAKPTRKYDGGKKGDAFEEEMGEDICNRIIAGQTLWEVCKADDMPQYETVLKWSQSRPSFSRALTRARMQQMIAWADDVVDLAGRTWGKTQVRVKLDDPDLQKVEKDGVVIFKYNKGHVQEARLLIDTKMKLMAKFNPEQFGERQILDIRENYIEMTDEELLGSFVREAKRAGMTLDRMKEIFEEYDVEEG